MAVVDGAATAFYDQEYIQWDFVVHDYVWVILFSEFGFGDSGLHRRYRSVRSST